MSVVFTPPIRPGKAAPIETYYRWHARIYDATRWSFLFGRTAILTEAAAFVTPARILEVGCGTGRNLVHLGRQFPKAAITGVDLSDAMLEVARRKTAPFGCRVNLWHRSYDAPLLDANGYDLVLFSYALSMFNPGFETAIRAAAEDLAPGGCLAVVDFHATRFHFFERWMGVNHVRMNGQLRPLLQSLFVPQVNRINQAYGGGWEYLTFVGRKKQVKPAK
jgi:S-adenosylmethionine-diacylgycerolhomoserine-N-methlytransferase